MCVECKGRDCFECEIRKVFQSESSARSGDEFLRTVEAVALPQPQVGMVGGKMG